jgi:hypothetical protein
MSGQARTDGSPDRPQRMPRSLRFGRHYDRGIAAAHHSGWRRAADRNDYCNRDASQPRGVEQVDLVIQPLRCATRRALMPT